MIFNHLISDRLYATQNEPLYCTLFHTHEHNRFAIQIQLCYSFMNTITLQFCVPPVQAPALPVSHLFSPRRDWPLHYRNRQILSDPPASARPDVSLMC